MKRTVAVVAVVGLVVLSGCSSLGGGASTATPADTETDEPTPTDAGMDDETPTDAGMDGETPTDAGMDGETPTDSDMSTPTATPVPESTPAGDLDPVSAMSSLPPGVEGGSVTNVTALATANQRFLTEGGHDIQMTIENSTRPGTGEFRIANDTQATLVRFADPSGAVGAPADVTLYLDAEEAGVYNGTSGKISYGHGPTRTRSNVQFAAGFSYFLPAVYVPIPDWKTAGSYTTDSGEERLVLRADAIRDEDSREFTGDMVEGVTGDAESVDARMEVTPDGLVRTLNVSLTIDPPNGAAYTQTATYTVTDLESGSLAQPDWLSEPPQLRASASAENRLFVVEHTGGPAIEAGTNLTVGGGFSALGNVSADQPITEGDTLYVYATGEGYDKTPSLAVNEQPTLPENATAFSGQTVLSGSQGDYKFAAGVEIARDSTGEA